MVEFEGQHLSGPTVKRRAAKAPISTPNNLTDSRKRFGREYVVVPSCPYHRHQAAFPRE